MRLRDTLEGPVEGPAGPRARGGGSVVGRSAFVARRTGRRRLSKEKRGVAADVQEGKVVITIDVRLVITDIAGIDSADALGSAASLG